MRGNYLKDLIFFKKKHNIRFVIQFILFLRKMKRGTNLKKTYLVLTTLLLSAAPISFVNPMDAMAMSESPVVATQAKWANVNNIQFTDAFSLFNSGVAKLPLGKPIEVSATVAFSGDIEAIKQAMVTFENVGQGIQIDYDQMLHISENQKQAQFKFFITLTTPIPNGETRLFTVKVSDNSPGDNKYLTPYSQRQTVIEDKTFITQESNPPITTEPTIEANTVPSTQPSTESSVESSTDSSSKASTEPSTGPSTGPSSTPSTGPSSESDTKPNKQSSSEPSSKPDSDTGTETTTKPSIEKNSGSSTESTTEAGNKHSSQSTVSSTQTIYNSSSAKTTYSKEKSQDVKADNKHNAENKFVTTKNRSSAASSYRYLPKTGENMNDRLLILGGITSFLAAVLLLIKRRG